MNNMSNKKIDVIIPLYNFDEKFHVMFNMLQKQTVKINHYIICETLDNLKKERVVNECPPTITHLKIQQEEFDHGRTRNLCAKESNADYILFMTQDAIPYDEHLIENLLNGFKDNISQVYAKQIAYPDCNEVEKYTRSFNYPNKDIIKNIETEKIYGIKNYFCSNVCCIYDKSIFDKLGGFEENILLNEDMFFAYKAIHSGYNILYKSDAVVYHSHNYSKTEYLKRYFDIAASQKISEIPFDKIPSEKEGAKLVIKSINYFMKKLKFVSCINVLINNFVKWIGYKLGQNYKILSKKTILNLTMNKNYWKDFN